MKVSWGHHTILQIRLPDRACNNATCRYNYPWQSWSCELAIKWINSSEPNDFLDVSDTKDKAMSIGLWRYICHSMSPVIQCDSIGLNRSPQGRGGVLFSILYHKWPCHRCYFLSFIISDPATSDVPWNISADGAKWGHVTMQLL